MKFSRWLIPILVLALIAALVTPALAADVKGKIKTMSADKKEFVVTDKDGKDWTFHMDPAAKVRLNAKAGRFADLRAGDEVDVKYEKQ